jgi:RNA polymerase sigma-70 factor (ECF subfamily)
MTPILARRAAPDRAFESFYRKHVGEVYHYALAVLANPADAEDVVQTTFLNAYRAFQRGEQPRKPHNWLIKIAHNVCRMRWRQASRRPQEVPIEQLPEMAGPDSQDLPDLAEVLEALAELTLNQRAALVMREVEGRSYAEIAEILNVSVPAVEALLFRARRGLKVRRKALGVISAVPVPGSLSSFFGTGSGLVAGGLLGTTAFKLVAGVTAGMLAAGAGYESVKAVAGSQPQAPLAAPNRVPAALLQQSPFASAVTNALHLRPGRAAAVGAAAPGATPAHPARGLARNAGLASRLGGGGHGTPAGSTVASTTAGSAVSTVATPLPEPVKKLVPKTPPPPPLPVLPTVPTVPTVPRVPTVPTVPTVPGVPTLPLPPPPPIH